MTKDSDDRRGWNLRSTGHAGSIMFLLVVVLLPLQWFRAQEQDDVAAVKQSLSENQKRLRQYQWFETTVVSLKGEQKSRTQKICRYGADGTVKKQQIGSPRFVERKEESADHMEEAATLIHQYIPLDSQRIQAAKDSGNIAMKPISSGVQLEIRDYLKPGDMVTITLAGDDISQIKVATYLESPEDAITLDVAFASLDDGTNYPAKSVLDAPAKGIQVVVQNTGYQREATQR